MKDMKKHAEQGLLRICKAPSCYGMTAAEITFLYELASMDTSGAFEALTTAYNAGLERGARLIENGNKRKRQQGRRK